jgi:hypothetical protein
LSTLSRMYLRSSTSSELSSKTHTIGHIHVVVVVELGAVVVELEMVVVIDPMLVVVVVNDPHCSARTART